MNTSAQALAKVVAERIEDVRFWMAEGFSKDAALAKVKASSTLGEGSWAQVVEGV